MHRVIMSPLQRNLRERDAEPDALVTLTVTVRYEPMEHRPWKSPWPGSLNVEPLPDQATVAELSELQSMKQ